MLLEKKCGHRAEARPRLDTLRGAQAPLFHVIALFHVTACISAACYCWSMIARISAHYGCMATMFSAQVNEESQKLLEESGSSVKGISMTSFARTVLSSCSTLSVPAT